MSFSIFKSRTVWVFIFMFIVGGVNATTVLPSSIVEPLMGVLALLGSYYHVNPSQTYNQVEG
jgi:membrane protein DedA with SNARE-associated domain